MHYGGGSKVARAATPLPLVLTGRYHCWPSLLNITVRADTMDPMGDDMR